MTIDTIMTKLHHRGYQFNRYEDRYGNVVWKYLKITGEETDVPSAQILSYESMYQEMVVNMEHYTRNCDWSLLAPFMERLAEHESGALSDYNDRGGQL